MERTEKDVQREIRAGRIIEIEPGHLMANMISLSVFPFPARSMIERIAFAGEEDGCRDFIEEGRGPVERN
ncbi:MAG: hypothetical protein R6U43_12190 [Candidatus Krumholzibacteriales bacterium]